MHRTFPTQTGYWSRDSTLKGRFESPRTAGLVMVRKHVPDPDPGWCYADSVPAFHGPYTRHSGHPFVIPAKAGIQKGRGTAILGKRKPRTLTIFTPWCVGASRDERLVRKWTPRRQIRPFRRKPESRGVAEGAWIAGTRCHQSTPFSYLGVPAPAGMSDWYENRLKQGASSTKSSSHIRHSREGGNPEGWGSVRQVRTNSLPITNPIFTPLVCRPQPA